MQTLGQFKCRTNCKHKVCQRQAHLGLVDRNQGECAHALPELTGSSIFLENILDLSHTLAQIMIVCGIHERKAKPAVDLITYAFLNYDLVCYCLDARPTKRLRKEDLFHELGRKCLMNRVEAHLCYNIIKRGFKAFYYFPQGEEAEFAKLQSDNNNQNKNSSFSEECLYVHAAKRTAEAYGRFEGLSSVEQGGVEAKILVLYKKFYDRLQTRKTNPAQENCNCCFCAKSRGHYVYAPSPPPQAPGDEVAKAKKKHACCHCCKKRKSQKFIHPRTGAEKCTVCHRSAQFCSCPKYQFDLNWIGSIWSRPDMKHYYVETIEKEPLEVVTSCAPLKLAETSNKKEAEIMPATEEPVMDGIEKNQEKVEEEN